MSNPVSYTHLISYTGNSNSTLITVINNLVKTDVQLSECVCWLGGKLVVICYDTKHKYFVLLCMHTDAYLSLIHI